MNKMNILSFFALFFIHNSHAMEERHWDPPMTKEELDERKLAYQQAQTARWQQWKDALDQVIENNDVDEFKKIFRKNDFKNLAIKNEPNILHNLFLRVHGKRGYNSLELAILRLINTTNWPN